MNIFVGIIIPRHFRVERFAFANFQGDFMKVSETQGKSDLGTL